MIKSMYDIIEYWLMYNKDELNDENEQWNSFQTNKYVE